MNDPIQDGVILSGSEQQTYARRAGTSQPLANSNTVAANSQFGSWHTGICQFVMGDGSVRGISTSIPGTVLGYFAARDDGNAISDEY